MATFTFTPSFDASRSSEPRVRKTQFMDGGYEHRIRFGLNTDPKVFNLTFANRSDSEADQIEAFFSDLGGSEAFDWSSQLVNRRNILNQTEDLTASVWTKGALQSVTPGSEGFTGASNAFAIVANTTNTFHQITRLVDLPASSLNTALSIYVRPGISGSFFMQQFEGSNIINCTLNLSTGQISSNTAGSGNVVSATATRLSGGWWRVSLVGFTGNASQKWIGFTVSNQASNFMFAGDGVSTYAFLMAPQLEYGSVTSYQPILSEPRSSKWVCEKWDRRWINCNNNTITATFRQVFES